MASISEAIESFWKCAPVNGAIRPLFPVLIWTFGKKVDLGIFQLEPSSLLGKDGNRKEE